MKNNIWKTTLLTLSLTLAACDSSEPEPEPEPQQPPAEAPRCEASPVRCAEQSIDALNLRTTVSTGEIREEGTTPGEFHTYVDARAGGSSPKESYAYARFTPEGLSRVEVDDQAALASTDWDIAFRRFNIRVNSGVSGPSCIAVAQTPAGTTFDSVKAVDSTWEFRTENYFTESCEVISGEATLGSPETLLGGFWTYQACLAMTGDVFVVRLADGRHVKLEVTHYYDPAPQQTCNQTGSVPQPSGAAQIRVRWAFLP